MVAAFPSSISAVHQSILQDSYSEVPETNILRFQPEVGPPKLRRRMSLSQDILTCKMWLSSTDWNTLKDFFRNTLLDGTLSFTWVHPRNKTAATFKFEGDVPKITSTFGITFEVQFALRLISGGQPILALETGAPFGLEDGATELEMG